MSRLNGKIALITGGTTGIGFATAQLFIQEGAKVAITGQNQERLDHAAKTLGTEGLAMQADTRSLDDLDAVMARIKEQWGRLDILFVNAGVVKLSPVLDIAEVLNPDIKLHIKLYKHLWEHIIAQMYNRTPTTQFELQIAELI